ncbi:hypothetical protein S4A8_14814 [Salinisphaera sp. S4-8]|uniref:four-carbon acid sugar kinase family protein n=1 Tax=Salinisphaera sp. S4-8 TaxID=633357 RepID=UPI0033412388
MNSRFIQIIADDLTGALDAAAPFATPEQPMRLLLGNPSVSGLAELAGLTVSSASRDLDNDDGDAALERAFAAISAPGVPPDRAPLHFAKVDSVLRGRPVAETLARMQLWGATTCLFAPAFPEMGRRTVNGHQETQIDGLWQPAAIHDIASAFKRAGVDPMLRGEGDASVEPRSGMLIGDATEARHLSAHVDALAHRLDVVWAGSRGLAEAIAGPAAPRPAPPIASVIVGTTHPVTRHQVELASMAGLFATTHLIDPVPEAQSADITRARVAAAVAELEPPTSRGLLVVGGDTLAVVLEAAGAQLLDCVGEVAPGVPLSYIKDGRFRGVPILTKSGGFGANNLLVRLLNRSDSGDV